MIRFLMSARQFHFLHQMATQLRAWLLLSLLLFGGWAQAAPSACTAMWGLRGQTLVYWNGTTWAASGSTTVAAGNAMGGYAADGSLFYTSGVASNGSTVVNMHSTTFSNISGTVNFSASLGAIGTPTGASALTYTTTSSVSQNFTPTQLNFVGATFDRNTTTRAMFLYATANMAPGTIPTNSTTAGTVLAIIGLLDPAVPTSVSWKMLYESQGAGTITYPRIFGSGDIFADQDTGQIWILTNTQPVNQLLRVSLNYTGLTLNSAQVTARVDIPALTGSSAGIAVNPLTGKVYVSTGLNSRTFELTSHLSDPIIATQVDAVRGVVDSGNCVERPDPPTITKSFNPDKSTATVGTLATGTFTLTITNPNKTPIFLSQSITDTLPAPLGLPRTDALKFLTAACFSNGAAATRPRATTLTTPALSTTTLVIPAGAMIPGGSTTGGSCTFSARYTTTVSNFYLNTIPAGSLTTTAGINAVAATATFAKMATNFSLVKSQQSGSGTTSLTTGSITVPFARTYTYALTIVNSTGGVTSTATFTDTLPALMTPLLRLTPIVTGGGTCSGATATVAGPPNRSRVTGTFVAAPPGATCTVIIQGLGSSGLVVSTAYLNTSQISVTFGLDSVTSDNRATVSGTVSVALATITIGKTNLVSTLQTGQTTAYTVTVSNLGPAAAGGATFLDPPSTGLNCTSVTFTSTPVGSITFTPATPTLNALQTSGFVLNPFPAPSTATFRVTCSVTATGS